MAETQENNTFIKEMEVKKTESTPEIDEIENISKYPVSPAAESTVNTIAGILLIIGCLGALVGLIGGLGQISDGDSTAGWGFLGGGLAFFLIGLIEWAFLKVFVNISRNLYNINAVLHEIKNK